ncbi:hypothetical protein DFH09DRAFT_1152667 [Mycena vulgaris]|nr:hypothetical protein DFH09DRAFT_1152667 [Mycena vulgaris]
MRWTKLAPTNLKAARPTSKTHNAHGTAKDVDRHQSMLWTQTVGASLHPPFIPRIMTPPAPLHWSNIPPVWAPQRPEPTWTSSEQREVCEHFYRTKGPLPPGLSCEWEGWGDWILLLPDPTEPDAEPAIYEYLRILKVPGTMRPLAFYENAPDVLFLFEAAGSYYRMNFCSSAVDHYGADFASEDDFLARHGDVKPRVQRIQDALNELQKNACVFPKPLTHGRQRGNARRWRPAFLTAI